MRVIIIGAGLGGLCLAQGLGRAGIRAQVYERDTSLTQRAQGYRIHIDPDGSRALAATLPPRLFELFVATSGTPLQRSLFLDETLGELVGVDFDPAGGTHLAVNRLTLRQILRSGIDVSFGRRLTRYEADGADVVAHFADGHSDRCDILVGADGIGSAVRAQRLPDARIVDTGLRQIYGRMPLTAGTQGLVPTELRTVFTGILGPERIFIGLGPVEYPEPVASAASRLAPEVVPRDTEDYLTCSLGGRREWFPDDLHAMSADTLHALMREAVEGWHPTVRRIVGRCVPETLFALALRTSVPVRRWPASRVTLLGDAIHAMSPAGGAGANTALRDAQVLADCLATQRDPASAVREYETAMADYGFGAVRTSAANGARFLGQDLLPVR